MNVILYTTQRIAGAIGIPSWQESKVICLKDR